ncbi:TlpA family protein disulfide reductase [Phaeodactylibacter luteus]|uniref:TlpA family protein disulfide reductase n=1 Tax=Phaeodactylibacter luteus TaxID=1564516 RepID=A0A5C6S0E1_9BACT|nr:TlpA disulfide reductase family protein [Phaeodactylibacter luteus]TXB67991.1 TlpA family protein disulfide reductase [Phaeodactylibacter luteus]
MKKSILFSLALALSFAVQLGAQSTKTLPSVEVKTLDGQSIDIKTYADNGKITILSFWATWCSPCKKELDAIADLYPDWQKDYDVELVAVTIDTQRALAKVKPMVESKGWTYAILSDPNQQLRNALNFQTIPQTFVLDQSGNIVYNHNGYVPGDEYELEDTIKKLAGK